MLPSLPSAALNSSQPVIFQATVTHNAASENKASPFFLDTNGEVCEAIDIDDAFPTTDIGKMTEERWQAKFDKPVNSSIPKSAAQQIEEIKDAEQSAREKLAKLIEPKINKILHDHLQASDSEKRAIIYEINHHMSCCGLAIAFPVVERTENEPHKRGRPSIRKLPIAGHPCVLSVNASGDYCLRTVEQDKSVTYSTPFDKIFAGSFELHVCLRERISPLSGHHKSLHK